jgi:hypothetical protein
MSMVHRWGHLSFHFLLRREELTTKLTPSFKLSLSKRNLYICGGPEKVGKSNNFKNELTMFTP